MKKFIKSIAVFAILGFSVLAASACDKHEHEFSSDWAYDATNHWHPCAEEECTDTKDSSAHTLVTKYTSDYAKEYTECSVCGYKSEEAAHTHTGGAATCTDKAECVACGQEYGDALGHDYAAPVYQWSDDNTTCVATRVCNRDSQHAESETAIATAQVTQEQSNTQAELTAFTATFENSDYTAQVKENVQTKDVAGVAKVDGVGYATIEDALQATASGDTVTILIDGEYTLSTVALQNKEVVFVGGAGAVFDCSNLSTLHTQAATGATLTFDGLTVTFDDTTNYQGLAHTNKVVYRNCTIYGKQCLYSETEFIDCTFINAEDYCVWTWGARSVTFTDCIFNTGGKAVLVYTDTTEDVTVNTALNGCVLNDDGTLTTKKGAVEVGSNPKSATTVYNITFADCTVNGFAENDEGIATSSTLWGNKNSIDTEHLNVVIDEVDVY